MPFITREEAAVEGEGWRREGPTAGCGPQWNCPSCLFTVTLVSPISSRATLSPS